MEEEKHWLMFVFKGDDINNKRNCTATVYTGYKYPNATMAMISQAKKDAEMSKNCACVSVVNLGYMTKSEFTE